MVEQDQIKVVDDKTYNELKHFAVKGKSYAADQGHDDLAMCLVMFAWMVDQGYIKDLTDTNARKNIAEANRTTIENETLPFGFSVRTEEEMKTIEDPWTIPAEQARWLSDQGYDETFPWPTSAKIKADPAPDKRLPATKVLTDDELEWTWGGWRKPES